MHAIQERELHRAVKLIKAIGCQYLIIDPNGTRYGELKIEEPRKRQPRKYNYGALKAHVDLMINTDAEIGDVQVIDPKDFDSEAIRATTCNILTKAWGVNTYTTHINKKRNIEIMRTA